MGEMFVRRELNLVSKVDKKTGEIVGYVDRKGLIQVLRCEGNVEIYIPKIGGGKIQRYERKVFQAGFVSVVRTAEVVRA